MGYLYSVEWANQTLRNAIEFLKEGAYSHDSFLWKQRRGVAFKYYQELLDAGYSWQAQRVLNWIHRLEPNRLKKAGLL